MSGFTAPPGKARLAVILSEHRERTKADRQRASREGERRRIERVEREFAERRAELEELRERLVELGLTYRQAELLTGEGR
jgi:hypothetical protein